MGWNRSRLRTQKNETEWNVDGTIGKRTNDLAEGPRSRTKRNNLKKSRNVPSPKLESLGSSISLNLKSVG